MDKFEYLKEYTDEYISSFVEKHNYEEITFGTIIGEMILQIRDEMEEVLGTFILSGATSNNYIFRAVYLSPKLSIDNKEYL